ncbi:MAG: hypothetical protein OK438_01985 [Thaumarchaeota archaeon]|nr:hypothetical protein [Nitrososphaerota archaeon]
MASAGLSRTGLPGILFAVAIISIIIMGNTLVYLSFRSNPSLFQGLVDNSANFPAGIVTAIFAPDAAVLGGSLTFANWSVGFAATLGILFLGFLVASLRASSREIGFRSFFYGLMLIVIPIASNAFSLVRGQTSVGPATVTFASMGLVLGFSILNAGIWFERSHPGFQSQSLRDYVSTIVSLAMVFALVYLSVVFPVAFFSMAPIYSVDWIAYIFCFLIGTVGSFWYFTTRET